jgi:hypothetical protein
VRQLQVKKCQGFLGANRSQEEARKDCFLDIQRERGSANGLISKFWPPELQENKFLLL